MRRADTDPVVLNTKLALVGLRFWRAEKSTHHVDELAGRRSVSLGDGQIPRLRHTKCACRQLDVISIQLSRVQGALWCH